jgi:glutamyl-tRNA synthetase
VKPGKLYQPIRVAITGTSVSPGIFESLAVLGKEQSVARVEKALSRLSTEADNRSTE